MADKTEIVIFGGIIVDQYVLVDRYPERGGDALMTDSFSVSAAARSTSARPCKILA
ncbi:hypothetical protein [Paenibacillus cisolokensis]|uniref:hypothetical protein n=1 Tax=Paenibacillus cisolokensis TaxID=1658519 RepID=UPI001BCFD6CB|nr:hypothetical protein [Paenibacillus cisolokensis]